MICKKCLIEKEMSEYYLKKNGKIRSSYCRECYLMKYKTEYDPNYYINNKEKFKKYSKNWSLTNDRVEYRKKYRSDNLEEIKLKNKEYRENNKEKLANKKKRILEELITREKRSNKRIQKTKSIQV